MKAGMKYRKFLRLLLLYGLMLLAGCISLPGTYNREMALRELAREDKIYEVFIENHSSTHTVDYMTVYRPLPDAPELYLLSITGEHVPDPSGHPVTLSASGRQSLNPYGHHVYHFYYLTPDDKGYDQYEPGMPFGEDFIFTLFLPEHEPITYTGAQLMAPEGYSDVFVQAYLQIISEKHSRLKIQILNPRPQDFKLW